MQGLERIEESADASAKRELAHAEAPEGEEAVDDGSADAIENGADDIATDESDVGNDE